MQQYRKLNSNIKPYFSFAFIIYLRCYNDVRMLFYPFECFSNALHCPVVSNIQTKNVKRTYFIDTIHWTLTVWSVWYRILFCSWAFQSRHSSRFKLFLFWTMFTHALCLFLPLSFLLSCGFSRQIFPLLHTLSSTENFLY